MGALNYDGFMTEIMKGAAMRGGWQPCILGNRGWQLFGMVKFTITGNRNRSFERYRPPLHNSDCCRRSHKKGFELLVDPISDVRAQEIGALRERGPVIE
jgi:hypothetical protein